MLLENPALRCVGVWECWGEDRAGTCCGSRWICPVWISMEEDSSVLNLQLGGA